MCYIGHRVKTLAKFNTFNPRGRWKMRKSNCNWLPAYCRPDSFLPRIPETRVLFSHRPYLFQEFMGKAMTFL